MIVTCPGRDSNSAPQEYKTEALPAEPRCYVAYNIKLLEQYNLLVIVGYSSTVWGTGWGTVEQSQKQSDHVTLGKAYSVLLWKIASPVSAKLQQSKQWGVRETVFCTNSLYSSLFE